MVGHLSRLPSLQSLLDQDVLRRRSSSRGKLSLSEGSSGDYSQIEVYVLDGDSSTPFALIAPRRRGGAVDREALPTVLAISGEEQQHVSKFFRAWRAEKRKWQVIVPLRSRSGTPYLFDESGVEKVVSLMWRVLQDRKCEIMPFKVESHKFHLVGCSNGGASVAAVAAHVPQWVASLTLVTGFIPDCLTDFSRLLTILSVRLYAGDEDELGHQLCLQELHEQVHRAGGAAELFILQGARHGNIGAHIDMEEFWEGLEVARWKEKLRRG